MGSHKWGYEQGDYSYNPYCGTYNPTYNYTHKPPSTLGTLLPRTTSDTDSLASLRRVAYSSVVAWSSGAASTLNLSANPVRHRGLHTELFQRFVIDLSSVGVINKEINE